MYDLKAIGTKEWAIFLPDETEPCGTIRHFSNGKWGWKSRGGSHEFKTQREAIFARIEFYRRAKMASFPVGGYPLVGRAVPQAVRGVAID